MRACDGVCRGCGKTPTANGRALDVHHIEPFRFSGDNSLDNLVALCRSCHMRADDHGRAGSARFLRDARPRSPTKREVRRMQQRLRSAEAVAIRSEKKLRAFELHERGRSLREISRDVGVSHQTIANWIAGVHESPEPYVMVLVS